MKNMITLTALILLSTHVTAMDNSAKRVNEQLNIVEGQMFENPEKAMSQLRVIQRDMGHLQDFQQSQQRYDALKLLAQEMILSQNLDEVEVLMKSEPAQGKTALGQFIKQWGAYPIFKEFRGRVATLEKSVTPLDPAVDHTEGKIVATILESRSSLGTIPLTDRAFGGPLKVAFCFNVRSDINLYDALIEVLNSPKILSEITQYRVSTPQEGKVDIVNFRFGNTAIPKELLKTKTYQDFREKFETSTSGSWDWRNHVPISISIRADSIAKVI